MSFRHPRTIADRYIPKGATKISDKRSDAVAYVYQLAGHKPAYLVYFGKQSRPVRHHSVSSIEIAHAGIAECFKGRQAVAEWKAGRAAARKAWANDFTVGTIVNTCWGYDQTNVEHYEVTEVRGKHVMVRRLATTSFSTGWAQDKCAPLPGEYVGEPIRCLAQPDGIKVGGHWATRTRYTETVPGVRVYGASHRSSYA